VNSKQSKINRRDFLSRSAKASLLAAGAAGASRLLYDNEPPEPHITGDLVSLPDFSIPYEPGNAMSIVTGPDRAKTVNKAIELLGGIKRFIKPGDRVLIKPNVAFDSPPRVNATTNPQLIAEVVWLCLQQAKADEVIVADNPINNPMACFNITGIAKAATGSGAKIIMPRDSHFKPTTLTGGKLIENWPIFWEPLKNIDKVIGIAPVKDHMRSGASMTMKNWYGLLGGRRNIFHQNINTIIAELAMLVKPTFVILDGTEVMVTNGPTGGSIADLVRKNTMIAGCDQVAVDTFGATLLNLKPTDLPYLTMAKKANVGTIDYNSLKPCYFVKAKDMD